MKLLRSCTVLICFCVALGCVKQKEDKILYVNKHFVDKGEPVFAEIKGLSKNYPVHWWIQPILEPGLSYAEAGHRAHNRQLLTYNNQAEMLFVEEGDYILYGRYQESDSVALADTIRVSSRIFDSYVDTLHIANQFRSLMGEKTILTPIITLDSTLTFKAYTNMFYNCRNTYLLNTRAPSSNKIELGLWSAAVTEIDCIPGRVRAQCAVFTMQKYKDGQYPLTIHFSTGHGLPVVAYNGSVTVSENARRYTFNLSDTTWVSIRPRELIRYW